MIEIEYGNKYTISRPTYPTKQIFEDWKKEFLKIEEIADFKIYLVGGFTDIYNDTFDGMDRNKVYTDEELDNMSDRDIVNLEKFLYKTQDIDIILTGPDDPEKIKKLIHEGIRLGYEKHGVFVDIMWFKFFKEYDYSVNGYSDISEIDRYTEKLYLASNTMKVNGKTKVKYDRAEEVIDGLWKMNQKFPTMKQVKRIQMGYEYNKPILINQTINKKNHIVTVTDQLDEEIYFKLILDTFEHFIDAIKKIDPSIYFWIHGGVFRKVLKYRRFDSDIDIYVSSWEDFDKLENVLLDMGYNNYDVTSQTLKFSLFGRNNIKIDLIKPFLMEINNSNELFTLHGLNFLDSLIALYWTDFVHASILLDSNFNLFFHKNSFNCIENYILEKQYRDINTLMDLIKTEEILADNLDFKDMILEMISVIDVRHNWGNREAKFIKEGYKKKYEFQPPSDYIPSNSISTKYRSILNKKHDVQSVVKKYFENIFIENNKIRKEMKKNINKVNLKL